LCGGLIILSPSVGYAAANYKIDWKPNTEEDLDGYGTYVRKGYPGLPYEHLGDVFLHEPANHDYPKITLTEVEDGT